MFWCRPLRQKRSPTRASSSSVRPGPRSVTTIVDVLPLEVTVTSTHSSLGVNLTALSITASSALDSATGSVQAVVGGQSPTSRTPLESAVGAQAATRSAVSAPTSVSRRSASVCSARARSSRSSSTWARRLPSAWTEAISSLPSGSSKASSSMRSSSAARGLRSWCEASATKARCCSSTSSTLSAISLNDRASLRSSGGPLATATRDFRRPLAIACVVVSSTRTGFSTQPVSRRAAPTATSIAAVSPEPMISQPSRVRERI